MAAILMDGFDVKVAKSGVDLSSSLADFTITLTANVGEDFFKKWTTGTFEAASSTADPLTAQTLSDAVAAINHGYVTNKSILSNLFEDQIAGPSGGHAHAHFWGTSALAPEAEPATEEERQKRTTHRARRRMATLAYVNRVRRDLGLEPIDALLPGRPGEKEGCVIARSIRHGSDGVQVSVGSGATVVDGHAIWHDADVMAFVSDFDNGVHPDLIMVPPVTIY